MKTAEEILQSNDKFYINLGLQRIKLMLALLANPQREFKVIHVAGTNGKGSTCNIINQILIEHFKNTDKKIGLYTSPHLFSYCERIKINNNNIKENIFNRLVNDINNMAKKNNIPLSEFELLTTVAFYYFYISKVDYVILEVGLGGRYDATNVVEPLVEIITAIDFDHQDRLGDTLNKIAFEKAGIIKDNSKVIVNKNNLGFDVIKKVASVKNSKVICASEVKFENNNVIYKNEKFEFSLSGSHQLENLALALCAIENIDLEISKETVKKALKNVQWRYRLEFDKTKNLLIDGAHNPSGIKALVNFLNDKFENENKDIIFGCLNTKDYNSMLNLLFDIKNVSGFYFCEFDYPASLKFEELDDKFKSKFKKINSVDEIKNIIQRKNLTTVCGSLYMLGQLGKSELL